MLKDTGFQDTTLFSLFDKKGFLSKIHSRNKQLKMEDFPLPVRPTIAMCDLDGTENEIELRAGGISGAYWVRDLTSVDANDNIYECFWNWVKNIHQDNIEMDFKCLLVK